MVLRFEIMYHTKYKKKGSFKETRRVSLLMSLKASTLKSNEAQKKAIMKEVTSILGHIDDELKSVHEQGRHGVSLTVPITFSIPYMSNADAQRSVYYKILTSLLDREFHVKIELADDQSIFHITWLSEEEAKGIELQNALIAKHSTRKK